MCRRSVPRCAVAMSESLRCRALFLVVPDRAKTFHVFRGTGLGERDAIRGLKPSGSLGLNLLSSLPLHLHVSQVLCLSRAKCAAEIQITHTVGQSEVVAGDQAFDADPTLLVRL